MKILTALFALFILAIVILADMDRLDFLAAIYDFPFGDKVGHFLLFGILSFLVNLTFLRSLPHLTSKRVAIPVTLILALTIGLEEYSQRFFAGRISSIVDLLFSYAGVTLGAWLAYKKR